MHEMSVAQNLLATISAETAKQKSKPIRAKISCGILNAINDELLVEAFSAISKGTRCEGIKLEIEHKPMRGLCKKCGLEFEVDFSKCYCAGCDSTDFELLEDAPLILEEIEFETG